MLLGNVSFTSQDPRKSVDLKKRATEVLTLVRNAISSGKISLPDKVRSNLGWELTEIQKGLDSPVNAVPYECRSFLPAAWLQSRWDALKQPADKWYPHLAVKEHGRMVVDYAHASEFQRKLGDLEALTTSVGTAARTIVLAAEGWEQSGWKIERSDKDLSAYRAEPDPLLLFETVRAARCEAYTKVLTALMPKSLVGATVRFEEASDMQGKTDTFLLKHETDLKCRAEAAFHQTSQGTVITVSEVSCVDAASAVALVQTQRLSLLVLWLLYGNETAALDHGKLSYIDVEAKLKERGLSDLASPQSGEQDNTWNDLEASLVRELTIVTRAPRIVSTAPTKVKAWKLRGGWITLVAARTLSMVDEYFITRCCETIWSKNRHAGTGMIVFLAGDVDGPTLRHIQLTNFRLRRPFGIASLNAGICAHCPSLSALQMLPEVERIFKMVKQPCPSAKSEDPLLSLAPNMSILDPALSLCWLAVQHCEYLQRGVAFSESMKQER